MKEIWKDICGYIGFYQVSNLGNVRSLDRNYIDITGRNVNRKGILLKKGKTKRGYHVVRLCKDSVQLTYKVHKLVAMEFLGHKPNGYKDIIDHINNNKLDNRVSNLQITTPRVNTTKDKFRYNYSSNHIGVHFCNRDKKWVSRIRINGKMKYLGSFYDELEAAKAYQEKLSEINAI